MSQIINHFQVSLLRFCQEFDSRKPYSDALPSTLHCSGQFLTSIFFLIQTIPHQVQAHSQSVCVCLNCRSIWEQNTILCYSMIFIQITDIFHYLVVRVRTFASFKKFTPYFACADLQGVGQNPSLKKSTFIKFKEWKKHRAPSPPAKHNYPWNKNMDPRMCFAQPSIVIARPKKKCFASD